MLMEIFKGVMYALIAVAGFEIVIRRRWRRAKMLLGCVFAIAAGIVVGTSLLG